MRRYFILFVASFFLLLTSVFALTEAPVDITKMSLIEIKEALDKEYITSEQLVNMYLERIEQYNSLFNAINQKNEHALEQAKQLDRMRKEGNIKGRLHGIPIIVKCNIDVYGMPTTGGTKAMKDNMPKDDAFVVNQLIDEGAIILASANMSEMAFSASDSYSSYGHVWNVFNNNKYTPYGSSGGSAVSVKAVFAAAALGTDTNSSVRLPASGAGLVGIRPTLGLLSSDGVIPYDYERDTIEVLTRTASDNSLILDVISDGKYQSQNKGSLKGVTIGVATQYVKGSSSYKGVKGLTDDEIYGMLEKSISELQEAGANIVYLDNFVKDSNINIATSTYAGITMCYHFNQYIKGTTGTIRSFQQLARTSGHVQALGGYVAQCDALNTESKNKRDTKKATYRDYVSSVFDENNLDVILYPSLKNKVYVIGDGKNISPGSSLGSVIGYPSITVPMGMASDGFSYGIEFLGRADSEDKLYNVALSYEVANKNEVSTSPLTPSLYNVPAKIIELNKLYEENINNKDYSEWVKSVKEFYAGYNNVADKEAKATELINNYNEEKEAKNKKVKNILKVQKNDKKIVKVIKIIIKIVLILVIGYILLYVFAYTVWIIRRIRRRIRKLKRKKLAQAKGRTTTKRVVKKVVKKPVKKKVVRRR